MGIGRDINVGVGSRIEGATIVYSKSAIYTTAGNGSADITLTRGCGDVCMVDPGGGACDVLLPSPQLGDTITIYNTADAAETLTVKTAADAALSPAVTIAQAKAATLIYTASGWMKISAT